MASSAVTISGSVTGLAGGTFTISIAQLTNASATGPQSAYALSTGNNTVTIPTGAEGVIIEPRSGNTVALTYKDVGGATGIPMSLVKPYMASFGAGATSFVLSAASSTTVDLIWI